MGIFQGLERRLRGAVDGAFARLFGGSVQPAEVTAALQHEAAAGLDHRAGRAIAPNSYVVELGPSDSADVGDAHRRVSEALQSSLTNYVHDQGWETFAAVRVTLRESDRLHTGQFRVSSLIDPSVGEPVSSTAYDAPRESPQPYPGAADPFAILPGGSDAPPYADPPDGAWPHSSPQYGNPAYGNPAYGTPQYSPPYGPPPAYGPTDYPAADRAGSRGAEARGYPADPAHPAHPADPAHPAGRASSADPMIAAEPADPASRAAPSPALIAQDGTGRRLALRRGSNIVGRGQDTALRLADTAVSRSHLDVYFDGYAAIVHDLGSTNGTRVNGTPVQTWQLADGDVIQLGTSTVVFTAR